MKNQPFSLWVIHSEWNAKKKNKILRANFVNFSESSLPVEDYNGVAAVPAGLASKHSCY